jgi:hypothetical protein
MHDEDGRYEGPALAWSPTAVYLAAAFGWVAFDEVLNGGPDAERGRRVSAYKRGRRRLLGTLATRDAGLACLWCGRVLPASRLTLDHVVPRSAGGSNQMANLCLACRRCNRDRRDMSPLEWYLTCRQLGVRPVAHLLASRFVALGLVADLAALERLVEDDGGDRTATARC